MLPNVIWQERPVSAILLRLRRSCLPQCLRCRHTFRVGVRCTQIERGSKLTGGGFATKLESAGQCPRVGDRNSLRVGKYTSVILFAVCVGVGYFLPEIPLNFPLAVRLALIIHEVISSHGAIAIAIHCGLVRASSIPLSNTVR